MVLPDDDAPLVERSQQGDDDAFANLVARHQKMIHALTYRMSGSADDADDLAQECFIRAWQQLDTYRMESRFGSWLYRVSMSVCLNSIRARAARTRTRDTFGRVHQADALRPAHPLASEVVDRVQEALQRLEPPLRAAIVLTVYDEMDHATAANVLGCAEATVSWRVFVARRKLRKWLTDLRPSGGAS